MKLDEALGAIKLLEIKLKLARNTIGLLRAELKLEKDHPALLRIAKASKRWVEMKRADADFDEEEWDRVEQELIDAVGGA